MSIRVLRVVDDPADKAHEGHEEDGCVSVPAGEELGKQAIDLVDESSHAAEVSAKAEVKCEWCGTGTDTVRVLALELCCASMLTNGPLWGTAPAQRGVWQAADDARAAACQGRHCENKPSLATTPSPHSALDMSS